MFLDWKNQYSLSPSVGVVFKFFQQFSECRPFASLHRFIPRYFILFDVMVNRIVSLTGNALLVIIFEQGFLCFPFTRDLTP